jgi:hypothetical protein
MGASVLVLVAYVGRLSIIGSLQADPTSVTEDQAIASDSFVQAASAIWLLTFLVCATAFIGWMHAGAKQVQMTRHDVLRYKPGWAIGAWFVPILNWFRPVQIINDLRASGNQDRTTDSRALVGWWWGLFVFDNLVARVIFASGTSESLDDLQVQTTVSIVGQVAEVAAAVLAILVVLSTTRRVADGAALAAAFGTPPGYGYGGYGYPPSTPVPGYGTPPPPGYGTPSGYGNPPPSPGYSYPPASQPPVAPLPPYGTPSPTPPPTDPYAPPA